MPARHAWHLRARWTTAPCTLPRQIVQNWGSTSTGATDGDITKILCQLREYQDEIKYQTTQVDALATRVLGLEGSLESVASKLAAVEGTLSKMAAARPKAPPPSMPGTAPSCRCGTRTGTVHATRSVGSTSSKTEAPMLDRLRLPYVCRQMYRSCRRARTCCPRGRCQHRSR